MRYTSEETTYLLGAFDSGSTVTITLYNLATGAAETLTSNACAEQGTTGIFKWSTENISSEQFNKIEYLWEMTDGTTNQYGKYVLGGYPTELTTGITNISSDVDDISESSGTITRLIQLVFQFIKSRLR